MLGLLWLTACLSAIDRIAMSVAIIPMAEEFQFTDTTKGSISSLLSFGYALVILPAGFLAGQWSPRLLMASGIALWSLATIATPLTIVSAASSIGPLLIARMLVGAGESILLPTSTRLLNEWTSVNEKSRALAFLFSGFQSGTIVALLLSPVILDFFGDWRELFYVYGSGSLLLLLPWLFLAKDSPTTSKEGNDFYSNDDQLSIKDAPWKEIIQSKGAWAMFLAHSAKNWGNYLALAWTPTFYLEQYGIGVRGSAWLSILPCVAGVVGGIIAGTSADAIGQRIVDSKDETARTNIRKLFQSIGLLVPALSLGLLAWHIPEQAWAAQLYVAVNIGFLSFNSAGYDAANQEKSGPKWAGLLYSVTSLPAVLIGTGATYLTGRILDANGQDWSLVFGLNALIYVLGAISFIILYDSKKEFE
ncbi:MFS transporter, ACS family, solute carrier family 17 (sodium-dependent inorganic phosphate cotransporter), other [Fistulifera solaris]|uniref:MFS transporter, ACS family, solute carrier family 17 (Sodium-dependent inorganic phosphate cotransporter), other n=1 Tax=Fistulifera solaris TaxID=1519565 RepID=A0A1Z5J955_FISSO|nr:MFS transporter, ACS family, solute carrier family 17 (sodium-dependent inorganic phosphate cotransporter), other [Fistulifera solaris]|eukprot:GAX10422.1 MFS transporter, ACS family, solute carrier family 17 (sodium-dependent inorganic phosphate cotransporter), other [Fistulifera solaris]